MTTFVLSETELQKMLDEASYKGAKRALESLSATKTKWISQSKAFTIYKKKASP